MKNAKKKVLLAIVVMAFSSVAWCQYDTFDDELFQNDNSEYVDTLKLEKLYITKTYADLHVSNKDWELAAKCVVILCDMDVSSALDYLKENMYIELYDAVAEHIVIEKRRITETRLYLLSSIYISMNRYENLLMFCDEVSNFLGYYDQLNYYKAKCQYALWLEDESINSFVKMLKINPNALDAQSMFLAGKAQYVTGYQEEGFNWMNASVDSCLSVEAYLDYAMLCYLHGIYDDAVRYLRAVVKYEKNHRNQYYFYDLNGLYESKLAMSYFVKSLCLSKRGIVPSEKVAWQQLLEMENVYDTCLFSNIAFRRLGMDESADSCLSRLVRAENLSAEGHYAAAYGSAIVGRYEDALRQAKLCLDAAHDPLWLHFFTDDPVFSKIKRDIKKYAKQKSKEIAKKYPPKRYTRRKVTLPFSWNNGIMVVTCHVNGIPTSLYFDSGAANVSLSVTEMAGMIEEGILTNDDIIGTINSIVADGRVTENTYVILKTISFDDIHLSDIRAEISDTPNQMLLLGQSVMSRFEQILIDYENFTITLTYKEEKQE